MPINFNPQTSDYKPSKENIYHEWLQEVLIKEGYELGEIEYIFVDPEHIVRINSDYLGHKYQTDIITFDNSYLNYISGEIYICTDVVKENSLIHSEGNFKREMERVILHGLLHLLGYKDSDKASSKIMRSKEDLYLKYLD